MFAPPGHCQARFVLVPPVIAAMKKKYLAACVLSCVPVALVHAAAWEPVSNTAMSITGKIDLAQDRVTFENGRQMPLEKVASRKDGDVYRVLDNATKPLLGGNTLCGDRLPAGQHLFLVVQESGDDLSVTAHTSAGVPAAEDADSVCGTYSYTKPGR